MAGNKVRRFSFVVVAVVGVILAGAGMTGSGAAVGVSSVLPVVTVSPSTGLVDLQKVTVTGSGFSANAQVASAQCRPGATGESDCDLSTVVYAQADQNGAFTQTRYVRRLITVGATSFPPHPTTVDCAATAGCTLGAGNIANLSQANGQKIFFNPNVPPKVPTIVVTPHTNLADHQVVEVDGTGFSPATTVSIEQCVTNPPPGGFGSCDYATSRYVTIADDGTFQARNFALERLQAAFTKTGSQTIDCATAPNTCDIQAVSFSLGSSTPLRSPLSFNPKIPPVVAAIHMTPSSQLHDLQLVTVAGTGFTPGVAVTVQQCLLVSGSPFPNCDYTNSRAVTAAFRGEFSVTFAVHRNIATYQFPNGLVNTDCATNRCELLAQGTQSQPPQTALLAFNPNAKAAPPSIAAAPNRNLHDNQLLDIHLRGFTPNQPVEIIECGAEAIAEHGNFSYCDYTTAQLTSPVRGENSTTFYVHRVIGGQTGLIDCAGRPGACILVAIENSSFFYGGFSGGATATVAPSIPTNTAANPAAPAPSGKTAPLKAAPGSNLPGIASTSLNFAPIH